MRDESCNTKREKFNLKMVSPSTQSYDLDKGTSIEVIHVKMVLEVAKGHLKELTLSLDMEKQDM